MMDTMLSRWLITCVFMFQISKVSLDEVVEAVDGSSVILPCLYNGDVQKSKEGGVGWRNKDEKIVHNIFKNEESLKNQDAVYRNRTKSFPEDYVKGNFSIQLSKVTASDQGTYSCIMTFADTQYIQLQVKAKQPVPTTSSSKIAESGSSLHHLHFILLIFTFLLGYSLVYNI